MRSRKSNPEGYSTIDIIQAYKAEIHHFITSRRALNQDFCVKARCLLRVILCGDISLRIHSYSFANDSVEVSAVFKLSSLSLSDTLC
jgi:hypothetical protein